MDGVIQKLVVQPEGKRFGLRDQETLEKVESFLTFNKEYIDIKSLNKGKDSQILTTVDGEIKWANPVIQLPSSGKKGNILTRLEDGTWIWAEPAHQLPDERVPNQILSIDADGNVVWRNETIELPAERENGNVLTVSGSSLIFAPPVKEIPIQGNSGDLLTYANNGNFVWEAPKDVYTKEEIDSNIYTKKDIYTKEEIDKSFYTKKDIDTKLGSVFKYKGTKNSVDELPKDNSIGDVWNILEENKDLGIYAGDNVCWTGTEWDVLSGIVDLSMFLTSKDVSAFITDSALDDSIVKLASVYYANTKPQYIPFTFSRVNTEDCDSPLMIVCRSGEVINLGISRNDSKWSFSDSWFRTSNRYSKISEIGYIETDENKVTLWMYVNAYPNTISIYGKKSLSCSIGSVTSTKPSYTKIEEITIQSVPDSLKNPYSLSINGEEYDGSKNVSISTPSSEDYGYLKKVLSEVSDQVSNMGQLCSELDDRLNNITKRVINLEANVPVQYLVNSYTSFVAVYAGGSTLSHDFSATGTYIAVIHTLGGSSRVNISPPSSGFYTEVYSPNGFHGLEGPFILNNSDVVFKITVASEDISNRNASIKAVANFIAPIGFSGFDSNPYSGFKMQIYK